MSQKGQHTPSLPAKPFHAWSATPPMGWNSWDCFGTTISEAQTKAHADYMAEHLLPYGWEYVVVDIQWYEPESSGHEYRPEADLQLDDHGRLLPAPNRFPSAAGGAGFQPLGNYIHAKGLKFGIHLMRGIPRLAVKRNPPVLGTDVHAADIADTEDTCTWNPDMYGVDMTKPGAQEYYDSVFALLASWGVDFVKVDDISRPYHDNEKEIEAIRRAIDKTGRPMVLSLSPGATALTAGQHAAAHANMWRISDDFWDQWPELLKQFDRLRDWTPYRGSGYYPDADMLPLGIVDFGRPSRFTSIEQVTLMTLWSIANSPLMYGGDLTKMDEATLALITNREVLAVNQHGINGRELLRRGDVAVWTAEPPDSSDRYLALFNLGEKRRAVAFELAAHGWKTPAAIRDLWSGEDLGIVNDVFAPELDPHGAGLYRVSG